MRYLYIYLLLFFSQASAKNNLTVIIHGVWFPLISSMVHKMDCPYGFTKAEDLSPELTLKKASMALSQPRDTYIFGWSGSLSSSEREKAAKELYNFLIQHDGPITLIGHSHGCNVALNLATIAEEKLKIDKLILLACPVQFDTQEYVNSEIFNKIYHFYSVADIAQIIDPQRLYPTNILNSNVPLLSQRKFDSPKVIQASILINGSYPAHNDFFSEGFMSKLPELLKISEDNKNSAINISKLEGLKVIKSDLKPNNYFKLVGISISAAILSYFLIKWGIKAYKDIF